MQPVPVTSINKTEDRQLHVLYAEDMTELRELMRIILTGDGHRIESCDNGRLALDLLSVNPADYDLLITDHHMPVMNGLELVEQVRRLAFPGKILVFSSELSPSVHAGYLALKVDRIVPKPIRPDVMRQTLVELFRPLPAADCG